MQGTAMPLMKTGSRTRGSTHTRNKLDDNVQCGGSFPQGAQHDMRQHIQDQSCGGGTKRAMQACVGTNWIRPDT
eukprot:12877284-Prorocentrum_lima.AAC.1